jgi:hypothetical protein
MQGDIKGKTLKREVALSSFQGLDSLRKRLFDLAQPCLKRNEAEKQEAVKFRCVLSVKTLNLLLKSLTKSTF